MVYEGLTKEEKERFNKHNREMIKKYIEELGKLLFKWLKEAPETDLNFFTYVGKEGLDTINFKSEQMEHATELRTWLRESITIGNKTERMINVQPIRQTMLETPLGKTTIIVEHSPVCFVATMEDITKKSIEYHVNLFRE
jgi:hypothetical protein